MAELSRRTIVSNLVDLVAKGAKYTTSTAKGLSRGVLHGLYTPFLLRNGIRHGVRNSNENLASSDRRKNIEGIADMIGQIGMVSGGHSILGAYAASQGMLEEYIAAIIATNVLHYLSHIGSDNYRGQTLTPYLSMK